ncbi:hypothetical protein T484DRAFT_3150160 [Baffinella frigidus]|nr:hypothetical protein T484DRAFT_3150160 [Cryptophyta sp. CCMP2293]
MPKDVIGDVLVHFDWDARIEEMQEGGPEQKGKNVLLQVAVLELLSALCVGRPPNPQLFASSFLSLADVVKNITRINFRAEDNLAVELPHSAFKVRAAYVRFLHTVYVASNIEHFRNEVHWKHSWFWEVEEVGGELGTVPAIPEDDLERVPLMQILAADLKTISDNLLQAVHRRTPSGSYSRQGGGLNPFSSSSTRMESILEDSSGSRLEARTEETRNDIRLESTRESRQGIDGKDMEAVQAYVFEAVLPMLTAYLTHALPSVALRPAPRACFATIFAVVDTLCDADNLRVCGAPSQAEKYFKAGRALALAMHALLRRGGPDFENHDSLSGIIAKLKGLAVQVAEAPTMDVRDVLEKSFHSVVAAVGRKLEIGRGERHLAALLAIDGPAPIADNTLMESAKRVSFEELLAHMLLVAKSSTAPEKTLLDVLEITRLSMYLWKPPLTEDSEAEEDTENQAKEIFEDFLALRPMHRQRGDAVVSFVQVCQTSVIF